MAPQAEFVPVNWKLSKDDVHPSVHLSSSDPHISCQFSFEVLRPNLFRTTFLAKSHPLPPHPQAAVPPANLTAEEIRVSHSFNSKSITCGNVVAHVDWKKAPVVSLQFADTGVTIYEDLPFRSYVIDGSGVAHYTRYNKKTLHVGLGEKAAPMDLSNREFIISATDCFG